MTDFINVATQDLIDALEHLIQSQECLRANRRVVNAFHAFSKVCCQAPSIVLHIREAILSGLLTGFSKKQIELLMMAVIFRSSSSWGTIPALVSNLSLVFEHLAGAIINENAENEAGDKRHRPHASMLFENFQILGETLGLYYLTPARYALTRQIYRLRDEFDDPSYSDVDKIKEFLKEKNIYIPEFTANDIKVAIYYCDLAGRWIGTYHTEILRRILGIDDTGGRVSSSRNPHDQSRLAIQLLELAAREASSVDEYDSGKLSYIGAYGLLTDALLGYVPEEKRAVATAWTRTHNDSISGQALGWENSAEEGHAEDAKDVALRILERVSADEFAQALEVVTETSLLRLEYWDNVVAQCRQWEESEGERIPLNQAHFEEPLSPIETKSLVAPVIVSDHALLLEVNGMQIKIATIDGAPMQKLLESFGVDSDAIQKITSDKHAGDMNIRMQFTLSSV